MDSKGLGTYFDAGGSPGGHTVTAAACTCTPVGQGLPGTVTTGLALLHACLSGCPRLLSFPRIPTVLPVVLPARLLPLAPAWRARTFARPSDTRRGRIWPIIYPGPVSQTGTWHIRFQRFNFGHPCTVHGMTQYGRIHTRVICVLGGPFCFLCPCFILVFQKSGHLLEMILNEFYVPCQVYFLRYLRPLYINLEPRRLPKFPCKFNPHPSFGTDGHTSLEAIVYKVFSKPSWVPHDSTFS